MIDAKTADFIGTHRHEDVRKLALSARHVEGIDLTCALQQIAGWQVARAKIPSWAAIEGVWYPPHLNLEQCSSEATARYKADLAARLGGASMVDLTGGMGVDFSFMARHFSVATYVEQQSQLCQLAQHNFPLLGIGHASVVNADGCDHLTDMAPVDLIFLDPARRSKSGGRTYAIADCQPDVVALAPLLLQKSSHVMVKLSPMLDWHAVVKELPQVAEVHILSVHGECKELVVIMSATQPLTTTICCVDDGQTFRFSAEEQASLTITRDIQVGQLLFEPNASVMKSGVWGLLSKRYQVAQVAENSHLFVGTPTFNTSSPDTSEATAFPGRRFVITGLSTLNKRQLKQNLASVTRANIATRNFPMTAVELRKRLNLADGGDHYLFGTTTAKGEHLIIICKKIS